MTRLHRFPFRSLSLAAAAALSLSIGLPAYAVERVMEPASGLSSVVPGNHLVINLSLGWAEAVNFPARVTLVDNGQTGQGVTWCKILGTQLHCVGLGEADLVPVVDDADASFGIDVGQLDPRLTLFEFPGGEVTEQGVRWNPWTLSCELELDDFQECADRCEDEGYPGSEAIANGPTALGCTLSCKCYTSTGAPGPTFPEPDDYQSPNF